MYSKDKREKVIEYYNNGKKTSEISTLTGISQRVIQRIIKNNKANTMNFKYSETVNKVEDINDRVLVIPDIHAPATDIKYLEWLKKLQKKYLTNTVVCLGDLIDFHTISNHNKSPESLGTLDEFKKAYNIIQEYIKTFPDVYYCLGNHDLRINRIAGDVGIPSRFMKSFKELFDIPETWKIADQHIINNVLYTHGTKFSGKSVITNISGTTMMSTVIGHLHTQAGVYYLNTGYKKIFTMVCGCLVNDDSYNFDYALNNKYKPVLGARSRFL